MSSYRPNGGSKPKRYRYPASHHRFRKELARALELGYVGHCWKCGRSIRQGDAWVLGHKIPRSRGGTDTDDNYAGYECRGCSDSEAGTLGTETLRNQSTNRWT